MNSDLFLQILKGSFYEFWWVILPVVFFLFFAFILAYYREVGSFDKEEEGLVFVELVFSEKVLQRPIQLMENIIDDLTSTDLKGDRISLEIVCTSNHLRFFIGVPKENKRGLEVLIYSQYPQLMVVNEDNYLATLPPMAFSKHVNFKGKEFVYKKSNMLSVLTYDLFKGLGKENGRSVVKDPYAILLEMFSRVGYDDIFCLHVIIQNVTKDDKDKIKKEISNTKDKMQGIVSYIDIVSKVINNIFPQPEVKELTDKDKAVLEEMKKKADSKIFKTSLRYGYFSPIDENTKLVEGIFKIFLNNYEKDNSFSEVKAKKVNGLFVKSRQEKKDKDLLRKVYSLLLSRKVGKKYMYMSAKEVVSLFHFPLQNIEFVTRLGQTSRGVPPSDLPIFK